ncbi:uncharacterized protein [Lolium perenne]|jgi:hypothetical protein|uniref:uncharacterized protein n=1 Tax=Lolium perenne TaxID=4522 RepID=UPI0021F5A6EC|nr:uncharacterized protein LOC127337040 [Lolium perenne]
MSLRYMISRVGARAAQAVREGAATARSVKDRAQQQSMARTTRTPATAQTVESGTGRASSAAMARKAAEEERRRRAAEESLRTVMFLSFWGPNT